MVVGVGSSVLWEFEIILHLCEIRAIHLAWRDKHHLRLIGIPAVNPHAY